MSKVAERIASRCASFETCGSVQTSTRRREPRELHEPSEWPTIRELAMFDDGTTIAKLKRTYSRREYAYPALVAEWEAAGLVVDVPNSVTWTLTAYGREILATMRARRSNAK